MVLLATFQICYERNIDIKDSQNITGVKYFEISYYKNPGAEEKSIKKYLAAEKD